MKELDKVYYINKNRLFILGAGFSAGVLGRKEFGQRAHSHLAS